ncbi:MAG: TetR/AcrR family transcriptional regulator [Desulfobacterales bacterium]
MVWATFTQLKLWKRERRRELITETARELFAQKAFKEVTVREIARAAGVSVGTIYNYYSSVGELFVDVFLKNGREIIQLMDEALEDKSPGTFKRVCQAYIRYLCGNITFFQIMSHFIIGGVLSEDARPQLNECMRAVMDRFEKTVRLAGIHTNTRIAAHTLFCALNGIMISYIRDPDGISDELKQHTARLTDKMASIFESYNPPADPARIQ